MQAHLSSEDGLSAIRVMPPPSTALQSSRIASNGYPSPPSSREWQKPFGTVIGGLIKRIDVFAETDTTGTLTVD